MRSLTILALLTASAPLALMPGAALAQYAAPSPNAAPSPANKDADELASQMRLLAANPQDLSALVRAGELTLRLDDPTAAAGFFARAERIDPRNPRIKAGLGSLLVGEERPGEALRRFAEAESLGGNAQSFAADRGLAYDLIGEQERAQRDYRAALRFAANDEASRRYALSLGISGKRDQALAVLDPLLRRSDRGAWRDRAFILAMGGDRPGAERIATSMLPAGMAQGLEPFFERLPSLPGADRAFAVHFGEIRPTMARIADARMVPALVALGPDPYAPVEIAAVKTVAPKEAREDKRRSKKRKGAQIDVATATPPMPLPPPPTYLASAGNQPNQTTAVVQPLPTVARGREVASIQPLPSRTMPSQAMVQAVPGSAPVMSAARPMVQPLPPSAYTRPVAHPVPTAQPVPSSNVAREVAQPVAPRVQTLPPTRVASVAPNHAAGLRSSPPLATGSIPIPAESNMRVAATTPQPAIATPAPAAVSTAPILNAPIAVVPQAPVVMTPAVVAAPASILPTVVPPAVATQTVPPAALASAESRPVAIVPSSTAPVRSEDSILAAIIAGVKVPSSEEERPAVALPEPRSTTRRPAIEKIVPPAEPIAADTAEAASDKKAADKKIADKKAADAKKAADLKKIADAKKAAEEKAKNDPKKLEPERIWVQVAGGANESTLPKEWSRLREKAPALFKGKQGWSTPLRATNRLVTGPFKSDDDARDFINALAKQGLSGFSFTSEAGQKITKLPTK